MAEYINQLTDEEIEKFFNDNGYELTKGLTDREGFPIDAIERGDEDIFVRAQKIQIDETEAMLNSYLMQKAPHIAALSAIASMRSGYGRNMELIHFSDFFMSKLCITEEDEKESEELCSAYISFMDKKFPTYRDDLYAYCDSLQDDKQQTPTSDKKPSTQDDGPVPTL